MSEILFVVEQEADGGFVARAHGEDIVTQADTEDGLADAVRDAVRCHFDEADRPRFIRLHLVRDIVLAA